MSNPQFKPITVILQFFVGIGVLALVLSLFQQKPQEAGKTDLEKFSEKKGLARDILPVIQSIARSFGLKHPDSISHLNNIGIDMCEDLSDEVRVYTFTIDRERGAAERPFDPAELGDALIRGIQREERENNLSVPAPYGVLTASEELCSILVFSVTDNGRFISLRLARTTEASYKFYQQEQARKRNPYDTPDDKDF
jgi:hypothetical protein